MFYHNAFNIPVIKACVNTRDNSNGLTCSTQLNRGSSCQDYLRWKDCDLNCNLCACSTAIDNTTQHCSGHGMCNASCNVSSCSNAKCSCNPGWTGDKCEILGNVENYAFFGHLQIIFRKVRIDDIQNV